MRAFFAAAVFVAFCGPLAPALQAASPDHPWDKAQAVVDATEADGKSKGFQGIQPHVADLEAVLASANDAYRAATPPTGKAYVIADGPTETLAALTAAAANKRDTVAVKNPYVKASFYLGTFYNETGRPLDALRVLDAGLALPSPVPGLTAGEHRPFLISERGAALTALKRWPEVLTNYQMGLKIDNLPAPVRARLLRGEGFAYTELKRLDDAEKAYRDSLAIDPNNQIATRELAYIAKLRAGGPAQQGGILAPNAPKPVPQH